MKTNNILTIGLVITLCIALYNMNSINELKDKTEITDTNNFFKKNYKHFPNYGRDIENLFSKCKLDHAKRVLFGKPNEKKNITTDDLLSGYELYKLHMNQKKKEKEVNLDFMYT